MTSQWVGDVIDTKQSCDQQPGSFTLDLVHKIQVVGKNAYFTSKTGSSHTSQDNTYYIYKIVKNKVNEM